MAMTLEEMNSVLKKCYKRIDPEEPDAEQQYYNNTITTIRYALNNELLKPEDLSTDTLYNWINNGIGDENLLSKIAQHKKEKIDTARLNREDEEDEYDSCTEEQEVVEYRFINPKRGAVKTTSCFGLCFNKRCYVAD